MAQEVLELLVRQCLEERPAADVTFAWQGGEPTVMGLDFFRRAVELQEKYRLPGARIRNGLQTNGTMLDDEWCRFFRQNGWLVGISLDGPAPLHDAYRVDAAGRPTFGRAMAGAALLREHEVDFNVLTTVHAANAGEPLAVYRFLRDEVAAQYLQFIPIVERTCDAGDRAGSGETARSVTGSQYGRFLCAIFDEWLSRDVGRVFVQTFEATLNAWMGQPTGLCVQDAACGSSPLVEHNGDVYSCDHFAAPPFLLGNLHQDPLPGLVGSSRQRTFGLAKGQGLSQQCRRCGFRFACQGGCPKDRLLTTENGEPGLNYLCDGLRSFFGHVDAPMRYMAAELRAGRPASNVMLHAARQAAELQKRLAGARRNDPCPCGSGRKFKRCCGSGQP